MILGIDSSAISAGCALLEGDKIVAEQFLNTRGLTKRQLVHSETLLPMISAMLRSAGAELADVEKIAVSAGPGSFTGLRIGISTAKGLADAAHRPCVSVSTLEAVAYNFTEIDGIICACMDARRKQVYNALFRSENGIITRLCEDRAISAAELSEELSRLDGKVIFAGDGAELMHAFTEEKYALSSPLLRYQRGSGVCFAAQNAPELAPAALMPTYLRLPQAERERLARDKAN
ncbi:MAG: tRNA (adenosine(37)-N6)-threonylcarbamoyltransferase complex dimerization subunit type 1 TsaB [Oscillospiraceae bacterium]|nr:tRNA (adenosine(37)-N6)-threonylcarbamoyltransferase complex dimerization subunit type 1 TsaB [Oscillospiraceae bacterium]